MDDNKYLDKDINENMEWVKKYIDQGYLSWHLFELCKEDKIDFMRQVYPAVDYYNKEFFIAALRVIGYKTAAIFTQLEKIRNGLYE